MRAEGFDGFDSSTSKQSNLFHSGRLHAGLETRPAKIKPRNLQLSDPVCQKGISKKKKFPANVLLSARPEEAWKRPGRNRKDTCAFKNIVSK